MRGRWSTTRRRFDAAGRFLTSPTRSLPDFLIIGAQKSGTSALYSYLVEHPAIFRAIRKEPGFFDARWWRRSVWYRSQFPTLRSMAREGHRLGYPTITGEATPSYLLHPLAPKRAFEIVPAVKLVALLRDPTERAISHHAMSTRKRVETLPLMDALDPESRRLVPSETNLAKGRRADLAYYRFSYVKRGLYTEQLDRWLEFFPRPGLLILDSRDLRERPKEVVNRTLEFLGVPVEGNSDDLSFELKNVGGPRDVAPATRAWLEERFSEQNAELEARFGIRFGPGR